MNHIKNLTRVLMAGMLLIALIACEGPEGPQGPAGPQGPPGDSYVNWEGYAEGIVCAQCHNYDYDTLYFVWGRKYQWAISNMLLVEISKEMHQVVLLAIQLKDSSRPIWVTL